MTSTDELPVYGLEDDAPPAPAPPVADPLAGTPRQPVLVLPSSPASFFRLVLAPPAQVCAALAARREIEHRLRIGAVHDDGGGAWSLEAWLRRPLTRRWVPVVIVLCPHLGDRSRMTLDPGRRVRASRRWFRSGHRALDRLARETATASP
ncbi:MAG TPA: hypothetical protein VFU93_02595 [Acidimicrobiales bacterium]|nr:hypothetical protein [Acidimicrobiales bacterium]